MWGWQNDVISYIWLLRFLQVYCELHSCWGCKHLYNDFPLEDCGWSDGLVFVGLRPLLRPFIRLLNISIFSPSFFDDVKNDSFVYFHTDGVLHLCSLLCEDEKQAVAVKSQLQQLARPMYSNPPVHGPLIVSTILGDPDLKNLWLREVKVIHGSFL